MSVKPTPWCFNPGYTVANCPSPLMYSCPDSTFWPNPAIPCHTTAVSVPAPPVPQTGTAVAWGGLDLVVAGLALLLAAAPPVTPCPICGRRMPAWRLREGGCKPCVAARAQAAIEAQRP